MKVRLKCSVGKASGDIPAGVTAGVIYLVIGIAADNYRLLNDDGEPIIYDSPLFDVVDGTLPSDWIHETGSDGEHYAYPPELNAVGFFEDYHDGVPSAVEAFRRFVASLKDAN